MIWIIILLILILAVLLLFMFLVSCASNNTLKELQNISLRLYQIEQKK
jgi:uncharacterized protein YpmB